LGKAIVEGPMAWLARMRAPIVPRDMPGSFGKWPSDPGQG
jgi:hypothetical protein